MLNPTHSVNQSTQLNRMLSTWLIAFETARKMMTVNNCNHYHDSSLLFHTQNLLVEVSY